MSTHRATNWLLAAIVALCLGGAYHLDGVTDHSSEMAQARALDAAAKAQAALDRFDRAAAAMCGNAGVALQDDGSVRCVPRKGRGQGAVVALARVQP